MQFVDEVTIHVNAGGGGHGCLSFRREKCAPEGGPDGGNGGKGGDVYLRAHSDLNTLVDFRYQRRHKAQRGQDGSGRSRSGKGGEDLIIDVPVGTSIYAHNTNELIADLTQAGQIVIVARGGRYGIGNEFYKSSTNRAPRHTTQGKPGEQRELRLELKLLADVGLLGLPNAGKSTLVRACSNAKPKVANYPFTTIKPQLGMVRIGPQQSFVMADIPGLIPGAAQGAGLGTRFLRHLSRTAILLHVVDIAPMDASGETAVVDSIQRSISAIQHELQQYDDALLQKPRWLVFNKIDCLDEQSCQQLAQSITKNLTWDGPVYCISASAQRGTQKLCQDLMRYIASCAQPLAVSQTDT